MRELKLPDTIDYRSSPTMKRSWYAFCDGWRPHGWWWHVAYVIRSKRVRHADEEKIKRIMCLVDSKLPHLREEYVRPDRNTTSALPSYERLRRREANGFDGMR
tara:strand:+ start:4200 stop:4508 length:309 start_codon:yes stop_codon:yes gene_type:complete